MGSENNRSTEKIDTRNLRVGDERKGGKLAVFYEGNVDLVLTFLIH